MNAGSDSKPELQTGLLNRVAGGRLADRMSGLESLDLSVAEPEPTAHLKLVHSDGAWFQRKTKEFPQGNAWQLSAADPGLRVELQLPQKHGVVLILEMCRTAYNTLADLPVLVDVNGEEWPLELDPRDLRFTRQSWYLPHLILKAGRNVISLRLAADARTQVLVRSVAVMRFDVEKQARGNWCWAAVTNSLLSFFNPANERTQCEIVKECFELTKGFETETDCCKHSRSEECNRTFKLVDALDIVELLSSRCNYPLSLDEVREQINQGVPVGVRIGWRGGGGHFVVITAVGPQDARGDNYTWLRVADPKDPAASYITYRALKNRYKGEGRWTHSYVFERARRRHP